MLRSVQFRNPPEARSSYGCVPMAFRVGAWACAQDQALLSCPIDLSWKQVYTKLPCSLERPSACEDGQTGCAQAVGVCIWEALHSRACENQWPQCGRAHGHLPWAWAFPRHPALSLASQHMAQPHTQLPAHPSLCTLVSGNKTRHQQIKSYLVHTIWTQQNALLH